MKYREKPQTDLCNELDDHRDSQRSHLRVSEMTFKYENKSQKVTKKQKYCYVSMEYNSDSQKHNMCWTWTSVSTIPNCAWVLRSRGVPLGSFEFWPTFGPKS